MERLIREIPGYYYDKEKKKYFKIQASSAAPADAAYSFKDVKRRKLQDENAEAVAQGIARQRGRIQRSKVLSEPLAGGILAREQGQTVLNAGHVWAQGIHAQGYLPTMPQFFSSSDPLFAVCQRLDLGPSLVDFRIVFDNQLFTIRANVDKSRRSKSHGSVEICHDSTLPTINTASWRIERFDHAGPSTSLSINQTSQRLAMTWLAGSPHSGIAILPMAGIPIDGDFEEPNIMLGPGTSRGMNVSLFSSTPAPSESSLLFAFGSSEGIMTVDKRNFDTYFISPKPSSHEIYPKDIFALEFLSDNHSILLSGGRRGILNITDLRIPKFGADADVINHPSCITHVKQLDMHRIIIAGLNSSLCQYDLRFRKLETTLPQAPVSQKQFKSINNVKTTRPILQYSDFQNSASIQLGFDVDTEIGVVAAAQEQDATHSAVQIFSLHGGQRLSAPGLSMLPFNDSRNIKCVRFARDIDQNTKSLYIASGDIRRYSWTSEEEADSC